MNIDPSIFRAYDIRGVYPSEINEETAYAIGRAFATLMRSENPGRELTITVGADMRLSSPSLKKEVIKGLLESGVNVEDVGLVSTPTFYFAVGYLNRNGGIQVSASHNPADWNGIKATRSEGRALSGETGISELGRIIENDDFLNAGKEGVLTAADDIALQCAKDQVLRVENTNNKKFKIVADAANAMGAVDIEAIFKYIQADLIKMNFELDGTFPAHPADSMKTENTKDLCSRVLEEGADLGIAPDGDGDRYFFCDEKGEMIPQHILRGLMAQIELEEHPGATVAYDVRPGRITRDMIEDAGGKPIVTRVGHSLIKAQMREEGAIFGGESSGHYFYKLPYGTFEAPMLLVAKLLNHLSKADKPLSEVIAPFKKYEHSGEISFRLESQDKAKEILEGIKNEYSDGKQSELDGISVEYSDYWFNVRSSNTEPLLRLNMEATDKETLEKELSRIRGIIER